MARTPKNRFAQNRDVLQGMEGVASSFKEWRPATEVLVKVEAVPTIFPQYDIATRVMGHPIARFCRLRGPSNEGKTSFAIGLMLSFLQRGHFAGFADAERTTPPEWLNSMMGEYVSHPAFQALPVRSYEHTVDGVREFCETIAEARAQGKIPEETSGLIVIDSIRKLVPKNLLKELSKGVGEAKKGPGGRKGKERGVDGMGGRAGQIKAALNAAWCDELVPLLADTRMAMLVIARETEDPDATSMWDEGIKVGGGKALLYDSSLDIRVQRNFITDPDNTKVMFGERHRVEIRKTKVGKKELKMPVGYFHTSNGVDSPEGFDRARDVLELARSHGIIDMKGGGHYRYEGKSIGQGERKALRTLREADGLLAEIELLARNEASKDWAA